MSIQYLKAEHLLRHDYQVPLIYRMGSNSERPQSIFGPGTEST